MFLVAQCLTSCLKETQGHISPFSCLSANKHKYLCNFQGDTQGWAEKQTGFVRLFNLSNKFSLNNISDVIRKSSNFIYGSRKFNGQIQDIAGSGQQEQPLRTSFERTVSIRGWLSHGLWVALTGSACGVTGTVGGAFSVPEKLRVQRKILSSLLSVLGSEKLVPLTCV